MPWPWSNPNRSPTLTGTTVFLRLPQMRDYQAWHDLRRDSHAFLKPFEPRWSEADLGRQVFEQRVRRSIQEANEGTDYSFFIFVRVGKEERLVGGVTLSNVRRRAAQFVNLGYWMGQNYAGQGLMSEAVRLCVQYVFETLNLHRIHAAFLPHNLASRRVLEKNGFVEEGYAQHYLQIDGRWADHVLFGLTRERYDIVRFGATQTQSFRV